MANSTLKPKFLSLKLIRQFGISLLCGLAVFSNNAGAEDIKVVTEYFANYQKKMPDGSLGGYSTDVVNALFSETGDTPNIDVLPWARAFQTALTQPNTMIFTISRTPGRENRFEWVGSVAQERVYFWALKEKEFPQIKTFDDLKQYQISVYIGTSMDQYLADRGHKLLYRVDKPITTLMMLLNNRVDLTSGSHEGMKSRLKSIDESINKFKIVYEIEELNSNLSIAFQKDSKPELIQKYRTALQKLVENGTLARLKDKWEIRD